MIGNVARSMSSVQHLVTGLSYLLGFIFMIKAIEKYRDIGDKRTGSSSQEKMFVPTLYLLMGAMMIYLPTSVNIMANTVFGISNILEYTPFNPYNIISSMKFIIVTAGVIWFLRGCVLLVHASEPGVKEGPKGLTFLCAGILAMNFEHTIYFLNWLMDQIISNTMHSPPSPD